MIEVKKAAATVSDSCSFFVKKGDHALNLFDVSIEVQIVQDYFICGNITK